jgi:hypothetical protein
MFSMNLPDWHHDAYVEATCPPGKLERLAIELDRLAAFSDTVGSFDDASDLTKEESRFTLAEIR